MKYLLTKKEIMSINEAATDWDKSALGLLTKAVVNPLTWLVGSIKHGIKKRQVGALAMQWGLEYVKALRAVDLNLDVNQEDATEDENAAEDNTAEEAPAENQAFKITEENKPGLVKAMADESKYFSLFVPILNTMSSWAAVDNKTGYDAMKKSLVAIPDMDISDSLANILKIIPNNKITDIGAAITPVTDMVNDIKNLDDAAFNKKFNLVDVNAIHKLSSDMQMHLKDIATAYKTATTFLNDSKSQSAETPDAPVDLKVGQEYEYTNKAGEKQFVKLLSLDHKMGKGKDGIFFTKDDVPLDALDADVALVIALGKDNKFSNTARPYIVLKSKLKSTKQTEARVGYNKYRMLLEADTTTAATAPTDKAVAKTAKASYKLPTKVEDLLPKEELVKFETITDIKKSSFSKMNFIRLEAIKYEANYIYETTKKKTNPTDKEDTNLELKKVWDIGIKNVNDYFQKVIDVEAVLAKVPETIDTPGKADPKVVAAVTFTENKINNLQNMGITDTMPAGSKFDKDKLYAFDCSFFGQNNKSVSITLLMTPTVHYIETIDGSTYYWFKLMGGYKWNDKTQKIDRINIFNGYTPNKHIVENFKNPDNSYYIVLRSLIGKPEQQYVYIYSNNGKLFYNQDIVDDVATVAEDIKKYKKDKMINTVKALANVANIFRIKINQRFLVDETYVTSKKYPGILLANIKNDKGFNVAKSNHDKLIELIK